MRSALKAAGLGFSELGCGDPGTVGVWVKALGLRASILAYKCRPPNNTRQESRACDFYPPMIQGKHSATCSLQFGVIAW